jgi:2-polyprenyl-6-methoxyphenol hydroxylase-like FAD-dependent oxidoreductase
MSAIEDAEALSAFLRTASSDLHSIDSALKHVYRVRFKRTSWYQARSRATGLSAPISGPEAIEVLDFGVYTSATQWELQRPDMILPDN